MYFSIGTELYIKPNKMDTLTGADDQKLEQIKEILLNAVDEMEILVFNTEKKLIEEVSSVEDVVKKKENCTTVIALGRVSIHDPFDLIENL